MNSSTPSAASGQSAWTVEAIISAVLLLLAKIRLPAIWGCSGDVPVSKAWATTSDRTGATPAITARTATFGASDRSAATSSLVAGVVGVGWATVSSAVDIELNLTREPAVPSFAPSAATLRGMDDSGGFDFPFGGDPDEIRRQLGGMFESMQGAQKLAWADNAIQLAVNLTVAALDRVNIQGTTTEQAEQLRSVMATVFPEAVTLVREARQGLQ